MRAAKKPCIFGISLDAHAALPPSVPPPPPAPPNPALIPTHKWVHLIVNPLAGWAATGKWSMLSVSTEGSATLLWQHDWSLGQPHIIVPSPVVMTPSYVILLVGSTAKYYLPSFSVKQPQDGAIATGSATPVAVCIPAYFTLMQTCADIATKGFYQPLPGICFQSMTTRWVGFSVGDVIAGLIGVAGDSLAAFVISVYGGRMFTGKMDDQLFAGLGSAGANFLGSLVGNWPFALVGLFFGVVAGGAMHAEGDISTPRFQGLSAVLIAPIISWVGGQAAGAAGDAWGSRPEDAAPGWEQAPSDQPAAPAPAPAPADEEPNASPATADPPSGPLYMPGDDDSGGVCTPPPPWL